MDWGYVSQPFHREAVVDRPSVESHRRLGIDRDSRDRAGGDIVAPAQRALVCRATGIGPSHQVRRVDGVTADVGYRERAAVAPAGEVTIPSGPDVEAELKGGLEAELMIPSSAQLLRLS